MARLVRSRSLIAVIAAVAVVVGLMVAVQARGAAHAKADPAPPVGSMPDVVSARLAAAAQGSRVEVTSLQDEYSDTYVNPDGTFTTETSQSPLRLLRDGQWTDVDYDLQHVDGGWSPKVSPTPVVFSDGADKDAVALGSGGKEVDLSWDVTLPAPTIDGASATYDLGNGESLVLTAGPTGFEQSLVLAYAPAGLPAIKLPLDTSGLTMSPNPGGGFDFRNSADTVVYTMPAPVM